MPEIRTQTDRAVFGRGKKRVIESDSENESGDTPGASTSHVPLTLEIKKCEFVVVALGRAWLIRVPEARRAVTKKCPVCDEEIPVRLLDKHADLEAERLDEIMSHIGSIEVLDSAEPDDGCVSFTPKK